MKFISNFIQKMRIGIKEKSKPLGRWSIDYCNKKMDNKIDLSNEDHCGPCGQYIITKKSQSPEFEYVKNKSIIPSTKIIPSNKNIPL